MTQQIKEQIERAATERYSTKTESGELSHFAFINGIREVLEHPELYGLVARKPIGIIYARELMNQLMTEEISFSRFVELINEGGK